VIDIEGLREAADDTRTTITVNWCDLPEESWHGLFLSALAKGGSATRLVSNMLGERMPHRLALALCEEAGVAHQRMADLTKDKREQLIGLLTQYRLPFTGTYNAACAWAVVRVLVDHAC
jgi:predicted flavoprotein YhiN